MAPDLHLPDSSVAYEPPTFVKQGSSPPRAFPPTPGFWALTHQQHPPGLSSGKSTAQVFVWPVLCSGFHRYSVPGPAPLRPSQPPSPCLAVPWPSPSRQLVMF